MELNHELDLTEEFRTMVLTVFGYPASDYFELEEELNHILIPGTFLAMTVLAVNLLGDGLRDRLDPRLARRL